MDVNLKLLVGKLNDTTRRALEGAAGLCLSRSNYNVEIEHWLMKLLEVPNTDLSRLLRHYELDQSRVEGALTRAVDRFKTGNTRSPALSPKLVDLMRDAWVVASIEFAAPAVRTGHLLLTIVSNPDFRQFVVESVPEFAKITADSLKRDLRDICDGSVEDVPLSPTQQAGGGPEGGPIAGISKTPSLDQYTVNLTQLAKQGKIDTVWGRDFEIRQIIDILMRRRQNNPILTGEAGVGKTAVVEGFALRIAAGDVPEPLKNVSLRSLDLALLQAGAGVKGEFENRLKSVINEVKASAQPIILFIDEAHTMIGAGGQAGQGDAANLLKPALARGELRTIAATTWSEYKKYFEKDAALARRFQVVKVEEPTEEQACDMMRGLIGTLERHHNLKILDEAIDNAVRLSHRYITGRQLPDKAVSLLDTAAARVAMGFGSIPAEIEDARRDIQQLALRLDILHRERATGADHSEQIDELTAAKAEVEERLKVLEERWEKERELVGRIRDLRQQLERHAAPRREGQAPSGESGEREETSAKPLTEEQITQLRAQLAELDGQLRAMQGESPLMQVCVDGQTIAEVVSRWTGIPVGKMLTDEINLVSTLHERMQERVIGQAHALQAISRRIQTARAGLTDPRRPIGVFLLVGPSGVGKTESALTLADTLYGGERNMVSINMSEYQEAHTVSGLKGSPPGYVGYGEGGVLTEAVRRKPYCVVLLDEIEKAHEDVMELFYQVFDKGVLEDGEGREIDFKNTIILLTSNAGSALVEKVCADPDTRPEPEQLAEVLRPELLKVFKPAFLGRMTVVPYYPLADDVMRDIVRLQLGRIAGRVRENHRAEFQYEDAVVGQILSRCRESETGARNVDHIITGTLLPGISREILARMAAAEPIVRVHVRVAEDGNFAYEIA